MELGQINHVLILNAIFVDIKIFINFFMYWFIDDKKILTKTLDQTIRMAEWVKGASIEPTGEGLSPVSSNWILPINKKSQGQG